jgi:hypothetical protein
MIVFWMCAALFVALHLIGYVAMPIAPWLGLLCQLLGVAILPFYFGWARDWAQARWKRRTP